MPLPSGHEIEVVEDGVADSTETATALIRFWGEHGALSQEAARARLRHVICLLRDRAGAIAASSSAIDGAVAQVGNRRFWILRCFAPTAQARDAVEEMLLAARAHLAGRVGGDGVRPLGICFLLADRKLIDSKPEAVWTESQAYFAGWTTSGEQLRVLYFDGATV
jgi:hypothetical protein